jgi:glycosyltransferase involved in cell wall biosynthesis
VNDPGGQRSATSGLSNDMRTKDRIRVALVTNALDAGGAEVHTITLAQRLDRRRFDCELVPLKPEGDLHGDHGVPAWSPRSAKGRELGAVWRLVDRWRQREPDVVLAANNYATMLAWAATRATARKPRVVSVFHSSPGHFGSKLKDQAQLWIYGWVAQQCDALVYVSRLQLDAWAALGFADKAAATVIYNGIEVDRFPVARDESIRKEHGWDSDCFVIGTCARLRAEKRVEDLLSALELLLRAGVPARLLVIGDGPQRQELEGMAAARLSPGVVRFAGFQSDVSPYIAACDVMALVSDVEAFSISVLESMACAKAVVLTDVGGAREQIEHGLQGYIVPTRSPASIADAMSSIWRGGTAKAFGESARSRVGSRFSMRQMLATYEDLLIRVASSGARPT